MKKFTLSFFFIFTAAFLFAGTIEYTYYFNNPTVKDVDAFKVVTFDNTLLTGRTGEPALPYQSVKLLLPPGEEAISVEYTFAEETAIDGFFTLYPQQPSQPYSIGSDGFFHQDLGLYASASSYPARAWGEYSTHFLNGHAVVLASFTPLKYIPAEGKVSFYGKIIVSVKTRATDRAATALKNLNSSVKTTDYIKSFAQNPSIAESYPEKSNRDGEYQVLIITPQFFTGSFQELADLYLVRGLTTNIVSVESITSSMSGQDMQEKIRNFIIQEYQAHGIQHVLLGGDDEHIPHRGFYCHVQSSTVYEDWNIPADLYYSALDGNWNADGDESWAEIGEDDLLPDVSVARFPFSTAAQLQKLLHKTISYQDQPVLGEMRKLLIAGEELWSDPQTYGEDYLELLIGHHEDNGYTTDGIPEDYNFTKLYDSQASWGGWDLVSAINQGQSFVHHSGHANQTYVMRLNLQDITNQNFAGANGTDHNYTLMYTHGCLCGAFDENDCIGEAMVLIDNCAVAGAFNSRYGWFNEGQTEGPSAHLHREFVDAMYHDGESRIGAAHMISKIETSPWVNAPGQWEEGALRWCFYCCNIFGDPTLAVWTDEPMGIVTSYPEEVPSDATTIPVTVTNNGQPAAGLMCVIMADGEIYGCCATDSSGNAVICVPGGFAEAESVQLVVSGSNCLPNYYPVEITYVGLGEITSKDQGISVMPNPFTDNAKLSFRLDNSGQVHLRFYDLSGKVLDDRTIDGKSGFNELNINTAKWPEGIILASLMSGKQVLNSYMVHTCR
jgi:hypothetical protein